VSDAESFGMTLAEANACGRPVVGSDVGGIPSFVRDGENGLLAPPGDADALAAALARILRDEPLARALGVAGAARVRKEHQWDDLAEQTAAVLAQAAARRRRSRATPSPA
jgi:glycosyltransferase involved in cell wall biosynthesis